MRGRTFRALRPNDVVTLWNRDFRGKRGIVVATDIVGIIVRLDNGEPAYGRYQDVAMGDNSNADCE